MKKNKYKITKKGIREMDIWTLCSPGINEWVKMMVEEEELKICNDRIDKNGEIIDGWTGEDEIVSSIISFIVLHSEKIRKRIKEKRCTECGKKLQLVKGETHVYKYICKCAKEDIRVSIG